MLLDLDLRTFVVASDVRGNQGAPINDTECSIIGKDRQISLNVGMGNRVIVFIEANVGRLGRADLNPLLRGIGVVGQWLEPWSLSLIGCANRDRLIARAQSVSRRTLTPEMGLLIELIQRDELSPCKERMLRTGIIDFIEPLQSRAH